jgi:hypothetical protein
VVQDSVKVSYGDEEQNPLLAQNLYDLGIVMPESSNHTPANACPAGGVIL